MGLERVPAVGVPKKNEHQLDFYAWEEIGTEVYDEPCAEPHHVIRDPKALWEGREVFVPWAGGGMIRVVVDQADGTTWSGKSKGLLCSGPFCERRGWTCTVFGDIRTLARADFS